MRHIHRSLAIAACLACSTAFVAFPAAASGSDPGTQVEAAGPSAQADRLALVSGSPTAFAYVEQELGTFGTVAAEGSGLVVRTADGATKNLGDAPDLRLNAYSMSGSTLVAGDRPRQSDPPRNRNVYWWQLASGKSGSFTLSGSTLYRSAAPGGAILDTGHSLVLRSLATGATTSLGTPPFPVHLVVPGTDGFVVTGQGASLAYQSWADPKHYVTLDTGGGSPGWPLCGPPVGRNVACTVAGKPRMIPLDGGAPVLAPDVFAKFAVSTQDAMLWEQYDPTTATTHLASEQLGSPTVQVGGVLAAGYRMVPAYGGIALTTSPPTHLATATDATKTTTVVTAGASPSRVESFALGAHRILWTDNHPTPDAPAATAVMRERSVSVAHGHLTLGPPTVLAISNPSDAQNALAAGGRSYAWQTPDGVIHVHSPHGTTTVGGQLEQVSNRWLVTEQGAGHGRYVVVRDLRDDTDRTINRRPLELALSGHTLIMRGTDGALAVVDLATGHTTHVAKSVNDPILASGHNVTWLTTHDHGRLHNLVTGHTTRLSHYAIGLSKQGALLDRHHGVTTTLLLRRPSGQTDTVLAKQRYLGAATINNSVLAWVDGYGHLLVKRL